MNNDGRGPTATRRTVTLTGLMAAVAPLATPLAWPASAQSSPPDRQPGSDKPQHGIAMHGRPALAAGFTHLPHVNPAAPKGGVLRLGIAGTFDNLNPFIIRGNAAHGLRELVFESLMARAADEPFTLYGLIAESIETPADRSEVTFRLRREARFSDGRPLTADDVIHSHALLSQKGWPYHRSHYRKVARVERGDAHTVRFVFGPERDRELPLILGLMPVLPRHAMPEATFERTTLEPVIGSGPYRIHKVDPGRAITYRKNLDHWGRDLPIQRGRFNLDEISYEYFRDQGTLFEAFKAGDLDARIEEEPVRWAQGYTFPAVRNGLVERREIEVGLPAGMSALVMNMRRRPFDDIRVRRAFIHLLDGEWINRNLFHGLYRRTTSFFARSDLSASGKPADQRERALLAPYPAAVTPDIMEGRPFLDATDGTGNNRAGLAAAAKLLTEAGFVLNAGRMVEKTTGKPLALEFLASSRTQERLVLAYADTLKRLGITLRIRQVDSAQYWARMKSYDFDMAQWLWGASLSPGNEQINRWSSKAAGIEGTLNYAGVRNPAVDAMIDALLRAEDRSDFEAAVRALDRVLLSGSYVVPLFHMPGQWLAWRRTLAFPQRTPLTGVDFDTWWAER